MTLKLGDRVELSALKLGLLNQCILMARENAKEADPDDECMIQCYLDEAVEIIKRVKEEAEEAKQ